MFKIIAFLIRTMFDIVYVKVCILLERCSPCCMRGFVFYKNDVPHVICEGLYFIRTMFAMLYVRVCILLTREKHLYERSISLRREAWDPLH